MLINVQTISEVIERKNTELDNTLENEYATLFAETPFQEKHHHKVLMKKVTVDDKIKEIFNLN